MNQAPKADSIDICAMTAHTIDGLALSRQLRSALAQRAAALTARGHQPGLAAILVGEDPASPLYQRNKIRACQHNARPPHREAQAPAIHARNKPRARHDTGPRTPRQKPPATLRRAALRERIAALN